MKFPTPLRSMEAESGAGDESAVTEPSRKKIAERDWINAAGEKAETEDEAIVARYTYLADGKSFDFEPKTDDAATRMLAIFGAHTLMGNVTNTWKIEKGDKADSPVDAIKDRFALLAEGKWIDRSAGAVGAKLDKDVLAESITQVMLEAGKITQAEVGDKKAGYRQRLEDDPVYVRTVRQVKSVSDRYAELMGRPTKSLDDIA
jgi:hypothetical protein